MNPQGTSTLTTFGASVAFLVAGWAVSKGIIPGQDQATFANDIELVFGAGAWAAITWWKSRQHTPAAVVAAVTALSPSPAAASALVAAVNSEKVPLVKAVASSSPSAAVSVDPTTGIVKPIPVPGSESSAPRRSGGEWA